MYDLRAEMRKSHPEASDKEIEIRSLLIELDSAHYHGNLLKREQVESEIIALVIGD